MNKQASALGTEKISKLLLKQAIPASIGILVMSLNMIVDTIFVGRWIGVMAIAAITVVLPNGGETVEINGEKYKQFYGMSSETAMNKHVGGVANYRASEGKTVQIPYRGVVKNTVQDFLGSLRSTCTYVGASRLKELTKRTTFIRVQEQHNEVFSK